MKKISIIINLLIVALFYSQNLTQSENYIYNRTYLEPVTSDNPTAKQVQGVRYFDGLGRTTQNIAIKSSPTGKDLAVPSVYDNNGRQTKNYLPLPVNSQNGAFLTGVTENVINTYYGVPNAYSEVQLEKSPLARTEKIAEIGADWQMSGGHTRNIQYLSNTGGIVKRFKATTTWNVASQINDVTIASAADDNYTTNGYYNANTLFKLVTTDEEGNETDTYTNSSNQNILVRQINKKTDGATENLDTYYVYDEFGNLSLIIPPKAAVSALSPTLLDKLCYQYKYDKYNRLVEKKLPGKGWEYIVYDKQNRPVLTQDANLRTTTNNFGKQGWIFAKYDKFGRIVYTGFFANTATRSSMQAALNNMSANSGNNESPSTTPFTLSGVDIYYTKDAFPTGSMTILTVNYYDQYPTGSPAQPTQIQNQATLTSTPTAFTSNGWTSVRNTKTFPTVSYIKNIENDNWTSSVIWYDTTGRAIGTYGKNPLGGFTRTESVLDFSGKTTEMYTYHSRNTPSTAITVKDRFIYTPQNYLSKHYQQINANPEELLTEYTYNDLGQVINKKVGNNLQSIDYTYNIRNWLTGINSASIGNLGSKLFAYKIKYNTVEGVETPNNSYTDLKVKPKYNGGISEIDWKTAAGTNEPLRRYGYVYDGANRLRAGFFQVATNPYSKEYSEVMDYDLNGNISALTRTGSIVNSVAEVMDDLRYTYDGNQLSYTEETGKGNALSGYPLGAGKGQNIKYDGNGNMTDHLDKAFTDITYNFLNLPSKITSSVNGNSVSYIYAADGSKVQLIKDTDVTDYLGNFQYTGTGSTITSSILANEEGYYDFVNNRYVYQYTDHLGNVRLSYTKNTSGTPLILEENNYYPFGLKHAGYNTGDTTNNKFKYLYNSKELQANGNLDYGWRQYMPDLGRWNGMDQLAESYHPASPYAYVLNSPANFTDPDGRDINPVKGGWEFTKGDIASLVGYLNGMNSMRRLTTALSVWSDGDRKGNFWSFFASWDRFGATGNAVTGNIYVTTASDGAIAKSSNEIREIVWTRTKIAKTVSVEDNLVASDLAWRQPGRAQMMGSAGDLLGIFDVAATYVENNLSPEAQQQAVISTLAAAIVLRKPGLIKPDGTFYSVAFEMKLAEGSYPGVYRGAHFREANKALDAALQSDAKFASSMDELGIIIPRSSTGAVLGKSPANWVWHHQVEEGVMQLVPKSQHTVGSSFWSTMHPGNRGGFSIWGK